MPVVLNQTKSDYPFGMVMPGRNWTAASADGYRFGFNGMEGDDEISGNANDLDFGNRTYDPRIGRFRVIDLLSNKFASWSPYAFSINNPIKFEDLSGDGPNDPTVKFLVGFTALLTNKGISFNFTATSSISFNLNQVRPTTDLSVSIYNGGLGTSQMTSGVQYDLTLATHVTVGGGQGKPMPIYTLNNDTRSVVANTFKNSGTYGQLVTYNSATDDLTRQGMIGFRVGDLSMSSNNDTKYLPYAGGGTDQGWTGGLTFSAYAGQSLLEVGYTSFTGTFDKSASPSPTKGEPKGFYAQTPYQKSLNQAHTTFRISPLGISPGLSLEYNIASDGYLQGGLHNLTNNNHFDYTLDNKNSNVSGSTGAID